MAARIFRAIVPLICVLAVSAQTQKQQEWAAITGRVLNAVTGAPVGKTSLTLMRMGTGPGGEDWSRSYAAVSDTEGRFVISDIEPGRYRLRVVRNGFLPFEYGARASQQSGTLLELSAAEELKDVEVRLTPQGVIAGRVLEADGEPLPDAHLQLLTSRYVNGRKVLATKANAYTNDLGEYRIPKLPPGKYFLYAESTSGLPPNARVSENYVPLYYPGSPDAAGAIPLDVAAGAQVQAGDLVLRKARTVGVKGKVIVNVPGAGSVHEVRFTPRSGHDNTAAGRFTTPPARVSSTGEFEIRTLTPGSWIVSAAAISGTRSHQGRTPIEVGNGNIEGVVVTIQPGLAVGGRVRVDGEAKQDRTKLRVRVRRVGASDVSPTPGWTFRVALDGTFKLEDLEPDRYRIEVEGLPDGSYMKSVRFGDTDATYSGVDLSSAASSLIDVLVSPKAATVSGAVLDEETGKPAAGATVVLIPKETERLAIPAFYPQATTDRHGRFALKTVIPGEYKVYAWEDVESTAWLDPDFMKPLAEKGEAVKVGESESVSVQPPLIPAQ